MQMTPEARDLLDATVARVMARHNLSEPERAGVHYELMSHLHSAAQQKAVAAGRGTIDAVDLQSALLDIGGERELERAFVEPLARPVERAGFGPRFLAYVIDAIILGVAWWFTIAILLAILSPIGLSSRGLDDPFDVFFPWSDFEEGIGQRTGVAIMFGMLFWVGSAAATVLYFGFLEGTSGQSLGKKAMSLRVVRASREPMTMREGIVRNIAKAHFLLLALDTIIMLLAFREEKQRASDKIAETLVVRA